jgi:tellurite resistance protein TerC
MLIKVSKRIAIAVVGTLVTLIGILMLVGPGPGLVVFPAGLAILGTEFPWAQRLLKRLKEKAVSLISSIRHRTTNQSSHTAGAKEFEERGEV